MDPLQLTIFIAAGILTGIINTLAGSGSLVTLPIFMEICGLPATVANGTNRVGVLLQTGIAIKTFHKHGNLNLNGVHWLLIPAAIGAFIGSRLAVDIDDHMMELMIGGLMVLMLGVLFLKPKRWLKAYEAGEIDNRRPLNLLLYFVLGLYGGFIQAGVGIFLLAALVLGSRYDLVRANGVKSLVVLVFAIPSLFNFILANQVNWKYGLMMGAAQMLGAWLGARFANRYPKADVYIRYLLIAIVVIAATKFLGVLDWVMG